MCRFCRIFLGVWRVKADGYMLLQHAVGTRSGVERRALSRGVELLRETMRCVRGALQVEAMRQVNDA